MWRTRNINNPWPHYNFIYGRLPISLCTFVGFGMLIYVFILLLMHSVSQPNYFYCATCDIIFGFAHFSLYLLICFRKGFVYSTSVW